MGMIFLQDKHATDVARCEREQGPDQDTLDMGRAWLYVVLFTDNMSDHGNFDILQSS